MLNYRKTLSPKPDITRTLGIPTYDDLQQEQIDLKLTFFTFTPTLEVPLTVILKYWLQTPSAPHCQKNCTYVPYTLLSY